jgi:hypothetical protein
LVKDSEFPYTKVILWMSGISKGTEGTGMDELDKPILILS